MTSKFILTVSAASIITLLMAPAAFAAPKKNKPDNRSTSVLRSIVNTVTSANIAQAQTATTTPAPKDGLAPATTSANTTADASTTPDASNSTSTSTASTSPDTAQKTDTPADTIPAATADTAPTDTTVIAPAPVTPTFTTHTVKTKVGKTATTTATSSSFETAASSIISFIQNGGSDGSGGVYAAGTLSPTETKNLVALSMAMAALGILLCFGRVPFGQTVAAAKRAYISRQQPRASGSQA